MFHTIMNDIDKERNSLPVDEPIFITRFVGVEAWDIEADGIKISQMIQMKP